MEPIETIELLRINFNDRAAKLHAMIEQAKSIEGVDQRSLALVRTKVEEAQLWMLNATTKPAPMPSPYNAPDDHGSRSG